MEIGKIIKALRIEHGLTQEALALDIEMAPSHLSRIEKGLRHPSEDVLKRLAGALGSSVAALYAAAEGSDIHATVAVPAVLAEGEESDYGSDAMSMRKVFRDLNPANQRLAVEIIRTLRRMQTDD